MDQKTMLWIGGGVVALGAIYVFTRPKAVVPAAAVTNSGQPSVAPQGAIPQLAKGPSSPVPTTPGDGGVIGNVISAAGSQFPGGASAGLPSVPAGLPSVPAGLPSVPAGLPSYPGLPSVPAYPGAGALPSVPGADQTQAALDAAQKAAEAEAARYGQQYGYPTGV